MPAPGAEPAPRGPGAATEDEGTPGTDPAAPGTEPDAPGGEAAVAGADARRSEARAVAGRPLESEPSSSSVCSAAVRLRLRPPREPRRRRRGPERSEADKSSGSAWPGGLPAGG